MNTIGSFEAKTQLSKLLAEVRKGKEYVITNRGVPVAKLIPFAPEEEKLSCADLMARFKNLREQLDGPFRIREMIEDGRKS
jgi:prevent-host-death family protein